jgi:hypothetical protein
VRSASVMPRNLLGRLAVRVLAFEWVAARALIATVAAVACAVLEAWWFAAAWVAIGVAMWIWAVREELEDRRAEELS